MSTTTPMRLHLLPTSHPQLRQVAKDIPDLFDPALQHFMDDLIACGEENQGVGIAAPQVGRSLRIFVMASKPNSRYPEAPGMKPTILVHPTLLWKAEENVMGWEGCLSVPGMRGQVRRPVRIGVTFYDRFGVFHQEILDGFLARLFLHEYDHLQGILYPDRMDKDEKLLTLDEFKEKTGIQIAGESATEKPAPNGV
jgi:peptide deformylase